MATSSSEGGDLCTCPLCHEYSGPPASVEAHISRNTDDAHQGEVGSSFRQDLADQAEDPIPSLPGAAPSEDTESTDSEDRSDDDGASEVDVEAVESVDVDDDQDDEQDDGPPGIPVTGVIVVALVVIGVIWFLRRGDSTGANQQGQEERQQARSRQEMGGVS